MKITIEERTRCKDPQICDLGFESSEIVVDGLWVGQVVWPKDGFDYGMLKPGPNRTLAVPRVHPGYEARPFIRFGNAPAESLDSANGISEIRQHVKDELDLDYRSAETAAELCKFPWEFIEGFLYALDMGADKSDCSATALRIAIRQHNRKGAPNA